MSRLGNAVRGFVDGLSGKTVRAVDAVQQSPLQSDVPSRWSRALFGPGSPLGTMTPSLREKDAATEPRTFQYPPGVNATISPRLGYGLLPFAELRGLAENIPEISMCLRILTEEIKSFEPRILGPDEKEADVPALRWMIDRPDLFNPWPVWLSRFLYNVLVYDAGAVYRPRDHRGHVMALRVVDGSTLFAMVNELGEQPAPPAPAFAQVIYGMPLSYFNTHQIWYRPRHLRADAPYGRSPIEDALPAVRLLQNIWHYEESWYNEGTTPEQVLTAPENWTPDQILEFEASYNARMAGNTEERAGRIRFVPAGTQSVSTKEARFRQDLYEAAANTVRMTYGIPRTEFGESPGSGLGGTGFLEAMQNTFYRMGLAPLKSYIEGLFDNTLRENDYDGYKFELAFPKESLDPAKEEEKATNRFTTGLVTRNEARKMIGEPALPGELGEFIMSPVNGAGAEEEGMSRFGNVDMTQSKIPVTNKIPVKVKVRGAGVPVVDNVPVVGATVPVVDKVPAVSNVPVKKFDESEHPRAKDGKFTGKGGSGDSDSKGAGGEEKPAVLGDFIDDMEPISDEDLVGPSQAGIYPVSDWDDNLAATKPTGDTEPGKPRKFEADPDLAQQSGWDVISHVHPDEKTKFIDLARDLKNHIHEATGLDLSETTTLRTAFHLFGIDGIDTLAHLDYDRLSSMIIAYGEESERYDVRQLFRSGKWPGTAMEERKTYEPGKIRPANVDVDQIKEAQKAYAHGTGDWRDARNYVRDVLGKHYSQENGEIITYDLQNKEWHYADETTRSNVKHDICTGIVRESGVEYETVNTLVKQWAYTSNDTDVRSMSVQEAVTEEFEGMAQLSDWQMKRILIVGEATNFMRETRARLRAEEDKELQTAGIGAEYDAITDKYDKALRQAVKEHYPMFDDEDYRDLSIFSQSASDEQSNPVTDRDTERKYLRTVYNRTQQQLRDLGYGETDEIILFRGIEGADEVTGDHIGETITYKGNAIESWSISPEIALGFGRVVMAIRVPRTRIFSTSRTGMGCLSEGEVVLLGTNEIDAQVIYAR